MFRRLGLQRMPCIMSNAPIQPTRISAKTTRTYSPRPQQSQNPNPSQVGSLQTNQLWVRKLIFRTLSAGLAFHIFTTYVFTLPGAYGISMLPTIAASGDYLLISKYYRRGRDLAVGDVVSFYHPMKEGERAVKRVVGMPGDFVERDTPGTNGIMIQVPEGHCWVVGDNLSYSRDSRIFGPLPLALIAGKVVAKVSWTDFKRIHHGLSPASDLD